MVLMLGKPYQALLDADAPPDHAREAAEEVAAFDKSLTDITPRGAPAVFVKSFF